MLQWPIWLRTIAATIAAVFAPTIIYHYTRGDIDGLVDYARRAVKFVGLLIALPVGLICGLSAPFLETWLGPDFVDLSWLMSLMVVHLCVNLAVLPLLSIQTATNHVRWPGIVTLLMGAGNLALALLLAGPLGWGLYGVAAAGAILLTARAFLFTAVYSARIVGQKSTTFYSEMLRSIAVALLLALLCKFLSTTWPLASWQRLIAVGTVVSVGYVGACYALLLNSAERKIAHGMIRGLKR